MTCGFGLCRFAPRHTEYFYKFAWLFTGTLSKVLGNQRSTMAVNLNEDPPPTWLVDVNPHGILMSAGSFIRIHTKEVPSTPFRACNRKTFLALGCPRAGCSCNLFRPSYQTKQKKKSKSRKQNIQPRNSTPTPNKQQNFNSKKLKPLRLASRRYSRGARPCGNSSCWARCGALSFRGCVFERGVVAGGGVGASVSWICFVFFHFPFVWRLL